VRLAEPPSDTDAAPLADEVGDKRRTCLLHRINIKAFKRWKIGDFAKQAEIARQHGEFTIAAQQRLKQRPSRERERKAKQFMQDFLSIDNLVLRLRFSCVSPGA